MADSNTINKYLSSYDQIQSNYEKYKDKFADSTAEMVNSETFLNLLVAEMTNQDPLEPTSNTEFVTQMAQFTSLQYAQDSSTYAQANYAASLVGKTVTASKMEGSEHILETGVVESVVKSGKTYTVKVNGKNFDISKITAVEANKDAGSDNSTGAINSTLALGDTIARASMMIGMHATVNAKTDGGNVVDAGIIDSIQVKNGEVMAVIGDIAYKLSDIIEVRYAEYQIPDNGGTEEVPPVAETEAAQPETDAVPEETEEDIEEVTDEVEEDIYYDEDLPDLEELRDEYPEFFPTITEEA